ncbi:MFS transporter [Rhabdothermincola salaria]|uniref:MFS transporter n=1 Tax=Rhabdothermincola salaria TaxID=2903142 RepID=UPI001E393791|nr:MFS transporter [Rhabdothermincola salaria]MCD9624146.1 MFS transporter [Rhabdothermincola salaria]
MTATLERSERHLRGSLLAAVPLLVAVALLMAGNGLTSTLLGIRAGLEGFAPGIVGVVLAGYYLGFAVGSMVAPSTITRVGHVRVFAGLASLASAAVLLHVIRPEPLTWFLLRAVTGICISGLYVVTETWLNGAATNRTRGTLFSIYMVVVGGSLLGGQLLFSVTDPAGFGAFVIASVLVSLAVVPISLADVVAPPTVDPAPLSFRALVATAPLAAVGAALSGFTGAAMIGAGVVYAAQSGFDNIATALFIAATLAGGLLLQLPLGAWSDRTDRRVVIAVAATLAAVVALVAATIDADRRLIIIAMTMVAGGVTFPLYALCNAHLNDYLDSDLVVAGGARMVLVNGIGSVAGPILGATAVGAFGPGGLFVVVAIAYLVIAVYAVYRMTRRAAVSEDERAPFVPSPVGLGATTPFVETDVDELYPPHEGVVVLDGRGFTYRERGNGAPVVLIHDHDRGFASMAGLLPALAADGLRAIAPFLGGRDDTTAADDVPAEPDRQDLDDLLGVLRHLELPWITVVGCGSGAAMAQRFATEHPDRVEAIVVLVDDPAEVTTADEADTPSRPRLVLDRIALDIDPEDVADDITDFLRHEVHVQVSGPSSV